MGLIKLLNFTFWNVKINLKLSIPKLFLLNLHKHKNSSKLGTLKVKSRHFSNGIDYKIEPMKSIMFLKPLTINVKDGTTMIVLSLTSRLYQFTYHHINKDVYDLFYIFLQIYIFSINSCAINYLR